MQAKQSVIRYIDNISCGLQAVQNPAVDMQPAFSAPSHLTYLQGEVDLDRHSESAIIVADASLRALMA